MASLLPPEIVIKTEAHTERLKPECQGNAPADFHAKAAANKSIKTVACVDEIHSASAKK